MDKNSIRKREVKVGIFGLGYVGTSLAAALLKHGFDVYGYDINKEVSENIKRGKFLYREREVEEIIKERRITVLDNPKRLIENSDIIIIAVQTPIIKNVPDISNVLTICEEISKSQLKDKLIIIESTLPLGTMRNKVLKTLETSGYSLGDFYLAYVPERILPGNVMYEIENNPRVIGVADKKSGEITKEFYSTFVKSKIYITSFEIAELTKLVENAYRYINIAFSNEIALLCERYNIDVYEVIKLANTHPRVNMLYPGPGVGGGCLPKDTRFLLHAFKNAGINSKIINSAIEVNEYMPKHVVKIIYKFVPKGRLAILGLAYKGNVSDIRNSPSLEVINMIRDKYEIRVHDPYVSLNRYNGIKIYKDVYDALRGSDAIVILTDHDLYKRLDLNEVSKIVRKKIIIDVRNVIDKNVAEALGFKVIKLGCNDL